MIALDKSYMVTFSWEGKTKQIEVKSGNLIPVSEIPEIYAPDGKAVVWYNIKNIEIPASVTVIDKAAFQECISLESIVIPEGIAQISERTFNWCKSLESITIPATVTSIGFESFNGCEALQLLIMLEQKLCGMKFTLMIKMNV